MDRNVHALFCVCVVLGCFAAVGSRVYMMDPTDKTYMKFMLKNQEFTFDVDVSNMPCGLNGALSIPTL